jgi:hypothetical protein
MPMKLKFTQFNFVNKEESPWDESEEWSAIMEEGMTLFSQEELQPEFCPSDQTVKNIMDFARSHHTIQSRSLKFIDLYMN